MRNKILTILIILIFFTTMSFSCDNKHDNKYVKDKYGNVYRLEWRFGECYAVYNIDIKSIDSVRKNETK